MHKEGTNWALFASKYILIHNPKPKYSPSVSLALTCIAHEDDTVLILFITVAAVIVCQRCRGFRVKIKCSPNSLHHHLGKHVVIMSFCFVAAGIEHLLGFVLVGVFISHLSVFSALSVLSVLGQ